MKYRISVVESLIVLAIILVLLYFTAIWPERHMLDKARKASAIQTMSQLTRSVESYYKEYNAQLAQDHPTFMRMLCGDNDGQITFFAPPPKWINEKDELIDSWKTPYQIKHHGKPDITITSAGPNGHFDDEDDLVMANGKLKTSSKGDNPPFPPTLTR